MHAIINGRFHVIGHAKSMSDVMDFYGSYTGNWRDRVNNFYTVPHIKNIPVIGAPVPWKNSTRDFSYQDFLTFDVDKVEGKEEELIKKKEQIVEIIERMYDFGDAERYYVDSGHGVHFLVRVPEIKDVCFFNETKSKYAEFCVCVSEKIYQECGVICWLDSSIYEPARILRVPETSNKKENMYAVRCFLMRRLGERNVASKAFLDLVTKNTKSRDTFTNDPLKRFVELTNAKDCGKYYLLLCPYHAEKNPSFVMYKNGHGWGIDYHTQEKVSPISLLTKLTGKSVEEVAAELSGVGVLRKAIDIIADWAEERFGFVYVDNEKLYSEKKKKMYSISAFKNSFDDALIRTLYETAEECFPPKCARRKSYNSMPAFFSLWAGAVFQQYYADLHIKQDIEIEKFSRYDVETFKFRLRKIFTTPVMWENCGRLFRRSFLQRIGDEESGEWRQLEPYRIWVRKNGNEKECCIHFDFIVQCDPQWAHEFKTVGRFGHVLTSLNMGQNIVINEVSVLKIDLNSFD